MDEKTLQQIDDLVLEFQRARNEADRRQITLKAERDFQFIDGALERFALRVRAIGSANFSPGVLDEESITGSGRLYSEIRAEENEAVDRFVQAYEDAGSDSERREVLQQVSKRLSGSPLALAAFNGRTGVGEVESGPLRKVPAESVDMEAPATTTPVTTPSAGTPPATTTTTTPPVTAPSTGGPPFVPPQTGPTTTTTPPAATPSAGGRATSGKTIPPDAGDQGTIGFDLEKLTTLLQISQYATRQGMPQDLANQVARFYVLEGVPFEKFQSDLDSYGDYSQQTINEIFEAKIEGIQYLLPQRSAIGQTTKPRMVFVEREGEDNRPQMSQQPGISSRDDGYRIMRNPDGSRFLYDSTNPEVYLEELSVEARNELALWMYTRGMIDNPQNYQGLIMGTAQLLESANQFGRDLRWTMDTMDEVTGFNMDRYFNRLSGPIVVYDREEAMEQANGFAMEQLGRALTRSEQLNVVDAFNRRTVEYQRAVTEAAMRADLGEQVVLEQAPSLESMTTRWLEQKKPAEVQQAKDYSVMAQLMDMTLDGKFGEFVPLTEDFKFGADRE